MDDPDSGDTSPRLKMVDYLHTPTPSFYWMTQILSEIVEIFPPGWKWWITYIPPVTLFLLGDPDSGDTSPKLKMVDYLHTPAPSYPVSIAVLGDPDSGDTSPS